MGGCGLLALLYSQRESDHESGSSLSETNLFSNEQHYRDHPKRWQIFSKGTAAFSRLNHLTGNSWAVEPQKASNCHQFEQEL